MNNTDNDPVKASTKITLDLYVWSDEVGYSSAILVYQALQSYAASMIPMIAKNYSVGNHDTASQFWRDYDLLISLQQELFEQLNELALTNFRSAGKGAELGNDNQLLVLDDYLKTFDVK